MLAPVRLHYTITHHNTAILLPSHRRFHQLYLVLLFRTKLTPFMAVSAGHLQHCSIKYSKGKGRSARRQCRQCCTWGLHSTHHTVPCSNPRNLALYPPLLLSTGATSTGQHGQQRYLLTTYLLKICLFVFIESKIVSKSTWSRNKYSVNLNTFRKYLWVSGYMGTRPYKFN